MSKAKVLIFSGSIRAESFNKKLAKEAARIASELGVEHTYIDLSDYTMPIYNGDLEASSGLPEGAKKFKRVMLEHQGLIIASPEYNSSIAPLLKNAIDWASRSETKGEEGLAAYKDKVALLVSASPGAMGGMRGLVHLRSLLGNMKVLVMPEQLSISKAAEMFDSSGRLTDTSKEESLKMMISKLGKLTSSISSL